MRKTIKRTHGKKFLFNKKNEIQLEVLDSI